MLLIVLEVQCVNIPFIRRLERPKYTPLVFFTAPKGFIQECDDMEKIVKQIERELDLTVDRMDIFRDVRARAILEKLSTKSTVPFLYHRESCQVISVPPSELKEDGTTIRPPLVIDKARVRAWAKGMLLQQIKDKSRVDGTTKVKTPIVVSEEESSQ